ncbi:helix-turn-helix transcriptional regulator [Aeromonas taiwanensis]|uniref:helix-turn-helix transcriptional regulator n=1 Tax=Aeromonas taiwanensis TaxID=633417 RepID=UPI003BA3B618
MDDLNLTAEELRDFRRVLGWSQQKMADELDVARNTINRMEKGHMAIERRTALAVRYLAWHHSMIERIPAKSQPVEATVPVDPERGDHHRQITLPLPGDEKSSPAQRAWAVFEDALRDRVGFQDLKERYFKTVQLAFDEGIYYTYLFLLQLLERLASLPYDRNSCPVQWANIRELRQFAKNLYKANPAWH